MLSFFRRLTHSKVGVIITFVVLGVIALAFAAGDVTGLASKSTGGITGNDVAKVGKAEVTTAELRSRVQTELEGFRQQQPTLDMASFVAQGGFEGTLDRLIAGVALQQFGLAQGMVVSKRAVDGQIASIPGLQGPTGKFDPQLYQRALAERKLTDAQIRSDIARDTIAQQLITPTQGSSQVGMQLALPYASLLLEKRSGLVGFIPTAAIPAGPAPSDADLNIFYTRNRARYTTPERRVIRYAFVKAEQVKAQATPTEAEIAAQYQQDRARYAPTEKRTISQVVVADQAGANALAAKVKGGTSIADAARAAGLEPLTQTVEKPAYAGTTSAQVADTVFAAASGAIVGPLRTPLGWTIAKVDSIEKVPGKTLDQARAEIATALGIQKAQEALGKVRDAIDDSLAGSGTFDEIVADRKLTGVTTPALIANGTNPDAPGSQPDPAIAPLVAAAFQASEGDAPQMVPIGQDGSFALMALGRVVPATPRPLAQVREAVLRDVTADRARQAARTVANAVIAKVNKGMPLPQALSQTGIKLPAPRPLGASRAQLAANPRGAPPPLALLFSMAPNTAKTLAAPENAGWYIVKLDSIQRGNAIGNDVAIRGARADLGRLVGREYVDQFAKAVRADIGVKTDAAAVARVRADLLGQGGSNN